MTEDSSVLEWAQRHAAAGWVLVPLHPATKRPAVPHYVACTGEDLAGCVARTPEEVFAIWGPGGSHPDALIGGVTGHCCGSGRYVLDVDVKNGAVGPESLRRIEERMGMPLPRTRKHGTPSGGWHLVFTYPDQSTSFRNIQNNKDLFRGIDVRAHHGFVVLPGSVTGRGAYTVLDDAPEAPVPPTLLDLAAQTRTEPRAPSAEPPPPDMSEADLAWQREQAWSQVELLGAPVRVCEPGTKHDTLYDAALKLGGWLHLMPERQQDAAGVLLEAVEVAAARHGDNSYSRSGAIATIRDGFSNGSMTPKWGRREWPARTWDDLGNGLRLLDHYGHRLRYLTEGRGMWATYTDGVWTWTTGRALADSLTVKMIEALPTTEAMSYDPDREVDSRGNEQPGTSERDRFLSWVASQRTRVRTDHATAMASKIDTHHCSVLAFDSDPHLLNVANGVLDLRSGDLMDHDPGLLTTKQTVAAVSPLARCPRWDQIMSRQFPDDAERHWVEVLLAYAALREGNYRKLLVLLSGEMDTGKSQLVEALGHALGSYASSFEVSLLRDTGNVAKPRPDVVKRMRMRLVYTTEANDKPLGASFIKRVTGGDSMSARDCYSNSETSGRPSWTPVLAVNVAPEITGFDLATKRRIIVVDFPNTVPLAEQVREMPELLRGEADGILARLVAALRDEKLLDEVPARFQNSTAAATDEMSPVAAFMAEETRVEEGAIEANSSIGRHYQNWCNRKNILEKDRLSDDSLGRALAGLGWLPEAKTRWVNGKKQRVRVGRKLLQ